MFCKIFLFYLMTVPQVKGCNWVGMMVCMSSNTWLPVQSEITVHVMLVVFFQPLGEYLAILLVSIDKASVARVAEQMPLAVGDMLVE